VKFQDEHREKPSGTQLAETKICRLGKIRFILPVAWASRGKTSMKILVAHNRYQVGGGEDTVVRDECKMLRQRGHCVELLEENNDSIQGLRGALATAASIAYSARSRKRMKRAIDEFGPRIIHIHNWFPRLSPSIILEANAHRLPIVQTLHNYRMFCANALLYRDGAICTDCMGRRFPLRGVAHGCYRHSRAGSAVVTAAYAFHRLARTWDKVDLFIAVSEFERSLLIQGGIPAEKIIAKPNFVQSDPANTIEEKEDFALYVGRITEEKGLRTLLAAWNTGRIPLRLKILGDGPLADEIRSCAQKNQKIEYKGPQPSEVVSREMAKARYLVFPSEWYETFGKVVVEAFSRGTPVLAANLGNMKELVEEGVTGYRFPPGDAEALVSCALRFPEGEPYTRMCTNCLAAYQSRFTTEKNYEALMQIYSRAAEIRRSRR
jgi:glycosyltransferase involved in cell wall biosynthesis